MKMSKTRLFVSKKLSANILIYIKNKQHHFLKNVLRIKKEDNINLFDGLTGEWLSKVISINRDNIVLQIQNKLRDIPQESDLWLIFAPIKSYRMNITIQKATELGISRFIPILTEYTNQSKINFKNFELNMIEASEQSERLSIPTLDKIIKLDQPNSKKMIKPSQGVHIVLEKKFLDSPHAIMIPHTTDGRVLFAVPWKDYVVVGTTDTQIKDTLDEPKPLKEEINFIINNASKYMSIKPSKKDK